MTRLTNPFTTVATSGLTHLATLQHLPMNILDMVLEVLNATENRLAHRAPGLPRVHLLMLPQVSAIGGGFAANATHVSPFRLWNWLSVR